MSFEGHWIPSVAYTLLALYWGFVVAVKYARAQRKGRTPFKGSTTQPCFFLPTSKLRTMPVESILKIFGLAIHIFMEISTGIERTGEDKHLTLGTANAHHVTMISGFVLGAIVEILVYLRVPFPKRIEYVFNGLAFLIQVLIMVGHISPGIEWTLHKLWIILITCTFVAGLCEFYDPDNIWAVYIRIAFFLAQGSWLMQVAFVLWPHTDNPRFHWEDDHVGRTWMNIFLMIHMCLSLITLMVQYLFVYYTIDIFDRCYTRYELDVHELNKSYEEVKGVRMYNYDSNNKEYAGLLNEEESNESSDLNMV